MSHKLGPVGESFRFVANRKILLATSVGCSFRRPPVLFRLKFSARDFGFSVVVVVWFLGFPPSQTPSFGASILRAWILLALPHTLHWFSLLKLLCWVTIIIQFLDIPYKALLCCLYWMFLFVSSTYSADSTKQSSYLSDWISISREKPDIFRWGANEKSLFSDPGDWRMFSQGVRAELSPFELPNCEVAWHAGIFISEGSKIPWAFSLSIATELFRLVRTLSENVSAFGTFLPWTPGAQSVKQKQKEPLFVFLFIKGGRRKGAPRSKSLSTRTWNLILSR